VVLLACVVWYVVPPEPTSPHVVFVDGPAQTAGLGCGPAALMAVTAQDPLTASQLRAVLEDDQLARGPVNSLYDLATWARRVGLEPVGIKVDRRDLARVPLPVVVHVEPGHFLALMEVGCDRVVVVDQGSVTSEIPRRDFDRRFSGYVLCFKRFCERRG
jgi:ABC-type bacteriocin/lantibiotic exporter with double-glycine peptidase domain